MILAKVIIDQNQRHITLRFIITPKILAWKISFVHCILIVIEGAKEQNVSAMQQEIGGSLKEGHLSLEFGLYVGDSTGFIGVSDNHVYGGVGSRRPNPDLRGIKIPSSSEHKRGCEHPNDDQVNFFLLHHPLKFGMLQNGLPSFRANSHHFRDLFEHVQGTPTFAHKVFRHLSERFIDLHFDITEIFDGIFLWELTEHCDFVATAS